MGEPGRRDLLELLDRLNPTIGEVSAAIEQEAEQCIEAQRLKTHPGVGSLTALAFVLIGGSGAFRCGENHLKERWEHEIPLSPGVTVLTGQSD